MADCVADVNKRDKLNDNTENTNSENINSENRWK